MGIQDRLNVAYQLLLDHDLVCKRLGNCEATATMLRELNGPFLIAVNEQYEASTPKVIIVGQENKNWFGKNHRYCNFLSMGKGPALEFALMHYREFQYKHNSVFFHYFKSFRCGIRGSDSETTRSSVLWSNLFKLNHDGRTWRNSIFRKPVLQLQEGVFKQEIEALDPDVVIFLTGPNYDQFVESFYPDLRKTVVDIQFGERQLAQFQAKGLPKLSFRTYHPGYLNRLKPDKREAICNTIVTRIRENFGNHTPTLNRDR